jgi:hypothetical protein
MLPARCQNFAPYDTLLAKHAHRWINTKACMQAGVVTVFCDIDSTQWYIYACWYDSIVHERSVLQHIRFSSAGPLGRLSSTTRY